MNDDREPLSPDIQALLDAARALPPAPAASRDAVRARLDASLRVPLPTPGPAPALPRRWPLTLATFVVGALTGALAQRALTPRPAVVTVVRVVQAPPVTAAPAVTDAAVEAAPPAPALAPPAAVVAADVPTRAHAPREPQEDSLNGERAVLEIARTGLTRGQSAAAIAALERHARRYPRGRLAPERESMWVQALVSAGRYDAAREHAARFRRAYPGSMLQPVVDAALRQIP
jgi:hypothetical protein